LMLTKLIWNMKSGGECPSRSQSGRHACMNYDRQCPGPQRELPRESSVSNRSPILSGTQTTEFTPIHRLTLRVYARGSNIVGAHAVQRPHAPATAGFKAAEPITTVPSGAAGATARAAAGRATNVAGLDAGNSTFAG